MISDIICFSDDSFTCNGCKKKYNPGTLINVFRWDGKMNVYCMVCLQKMNISNNGTIIWQANQRKDPRMKED
jgi:hypothetical protein